MENPFTLKAVNTNIRSSHLFYLFKSRLIHIDNNTVNHKVNDTPALLLFFLTMLIINKAKYCFSYWFKWFEAGSIDQWSQYFVQIQTFRITSGKLARKICTKNQRYYHHYWFEWLRSWLIDPYAQYFVSPPSSQGILVPLTTELTTPMCLSCPFFVIMVTNAKLLSLLLFEVEEIEGQTVIVHNFFVRTKPYVSNQIIYHLQGKGHHTPTSQWHSCHNYMCLFAWCQMKKYNCHYWFK